MSVIHVQRIQHALETLFPDTIDMSDYANKSDAERKSAFLSRALAAYALSIMADTEPAQAARAITDGYDDNGIDGIYFDAPGGVLYTVQSKWAHDGRCSINSADCKKYLDGFRDLVGLRLDRFNRKVKDHETELRSALHDARVSLVISFAYNGTQPLSPHVLADTDSLLAEINDPEDVLAHRVFGQAQLYQAVVGHAQRQTIELEIELRDWGCVREPVLAYYGHVDGASVAKWWSDHSRSLFVRNIRNFKGSTDVNNSLAKTLREEPQNFCYFNNGITILCSKIAKKPVGGGERALGIFECDGVTVVNGAQTVGVIGSCPEASKADLDKVRVFVRLISLENCPEGFDEDVTRGANLQNRIEHRDFAALDENQHRIASEFLLDGKHYAYKSGDEVGPGEQGCSIVDATIALACASEDVSLAVQAKREIGRLWESIERPPYTQLFNDRTSATEIWKAVQIMRVVDERLTALAKTAQPRADMVAVHGNRLVLHRVFRHPRFASLRAGSADLGEDTETVLGATDTAFAALAADLEAYFPKAYLASLFKNTNRCRGVNARLGATTPSRESPALASDPGPGKDVKQLEFFP